jgi:hypothetical protein
LIDARVHGTGIVIGTGGAIRFSYAGITGRYLSVYAIARGRITGVGRARIVVVAVLGRSPAHSVLTHIACGAGVVVVAGLGIVDVHAALRNNGNIFIIRAGVVVIAASEHPGLADAVETIIAISAAVAVTAGQRVVDGEHTCVHRVAGVGSALVVVVARQDRAADTDIVLTRVVQGADVVIRTEGPVRLSCA